MKTIKLDEWGSVSVYDIHDRLPDHLGEYLAGDPSERRFRPAVLEWHRRRQLGMLVWSDDDSVPDLRTDSMTPDVEAMRCVAFAEVQVHVCFVCKIHHALPLCRSRHPYIWHSGRWRSDLSQWMSHCGSDGSLSRIVALLARWDCTAAG